jgi:hypothetical protein
MRAHGAVSSFSLWQSRHDRATAAYDYALDIDLALVSPDAGAPPPGAVPHLDKFPGFRHFLGVPDLGVPDDTQRFKLNGEVFDPSDAGSWKRAEDIMAKLAFLIINAPIPAGESEGMKKWLNPELPSGYTYFLQLIAHDLVHSSMFLSRSKGQMFGLSNVRRMPLRLETIYGGGPTQCPHAFEVDQAGFRNKLRLSRTRLDSSDKKLQGPALDIPRGIAVPSSAVQAEGYPEALIADARNDSHAIVSQITVLFHRLHNAIAVALRGQIPSTGNAFADAQLLFVAAQSACILTYRHLIRHDLLPKILHPEVYKAYEAGTVKPRSANKDSGVQEWRAPLEFTHGFFRFAHSMIRPIYLFGMKGSEMTTFRIGEILDETSEKTPDDMPFRKEWLIDWPLFFRDKSQGGFNFSIRIGPWSHKQIEEAIAGQYPPESPLLERDLLSSIAVRPWSLAPLLDELMQSHAALFDRSWLFQGYKAGGKYRPWVVPVKDWLEQQRANAKYGKETLTLDEILCLADDPPFPFLVRFEAGNDPVAEGKHLGILGSIVVADVFFGVFEQDNLVGIDGALPFGDQLHQLSLMLRGNEYAPQPNLFEFLKPISDFKSLVRFVAEN